MTFRQRSYVILTKLRAHDVAPITTGWRKLRTFSG
jgi:hypothetical protein